MEAEETYHNKLPNETKCTLNSTESELIPLDKKERLQRGAKEKEQCIQENEGAKNIQNNDGVENTAQEQTYNEDDQLQSESPRQQERELKFRDTEQQLKPDPKTDEEQKEAEGKNLLDTPTPQDTETKPQLQQLSKKQCSEVQLQKISEQSQENTQQRENNENKNKTLELQQNRNRNPKQQNDKSLVEFQNKNDKQSILENDENKDKSAHQSIKQNIVGTEEHLTAKLQNLPTQSDGNELSNSTADESKRATNKNQKAVEIPSNESTKVTDTKGKIFWKGRYVPLDNLQEILHGDVSSAESGTEEDSGVEKSGIPKRAFQLTESDKQFDFSDSASDISEDMEINVKDQSFKQKEIFKLLAEKEFYELKYHRLFHEKEELQKQMKKLEVEKESLAKKHQLSRQQTDELEQLKSEKAKDPENRIRENKILLKPALPKDQSMTNNTKSPFGRGSASPQVNGYADDIAVLATENKKFDEILDRLQLNPNENPQENDPLIDEMLDSIGKYIPKDDFLLLEQEKLDIESQLREKVKQYKEKVKELDEATSNFEDKTKGFEKTIIKLDERDKEKSQLLNEYELQIFDLKRKFKERLDESKNKFENERLQKTKVQEELEKLQNVYAQQEKELSSAKTKIEKLELEVKNTNEKHAKELTKLQEKLEKENKEKNELGTRVQDLLQDMMQLKDELSNEEKKHSEEQKHTREYFDDERMKLVDKHHEEIRLLMEKLLNSKAQSFVNVNLDEASKDHCETEPKTDSKETPEKSEKQNLRSNECLDCVDSSSRKDRNENPTNKTSIENIETSDMAAQVNELKKKNKALQEKIALLEKELVKLKDTEKGLKDLETHFERANENDRKQNLERITHTASNKDQAAKENTDYFQKSGLNSTTEREKETFYHNKKVDVAQIPTSKIKDNVENHEPQIPHTNDAEQKLNTLQNEINQLKHEKEELEKDMIESKEQLEAEYQCELERERKRFRMAEDEIASNASGLRRVSEDWEQMLNKTIGNYERELERSEQEKAKLQAKLESLENVNFDNFDQRTQSDSKQWEKANVDSFTNTKDHGLHARLEERTLFQTSNNMLTQEETRCNVNEVERFIKLLESERKRLKSEYQEQLNNEKKHYDLLVLEKHEKVKYLEERNNSLESNINALEKKKDQEQNDLLISFENEKKALKDAAEEHFRNQLNENKNDYERTLREMRLQMEIEQKDLKENIFKSREVLQEKIENEFLRKVLKIIKENTGTSNHEVLVKTQEYKDKIQQLVKQIEEERNKYSKTILNLKENFISEQTKAEAQSKANSAIMEKTIEELKKEVENLKKLKQELKQNYRSDISQLEEGHAKETKELNENWQKIQKNVETKLQEEAAENLRKEREAYDDKVHKANCELRNVQLQLVKMETKFNAEKYEMEKVIEEMKFEILSLKQMKTNSSISTEKHLCRSFEIEKDNIENNFHILREEIFRLQGYISELRAQLVSGKFHLNTQVSPPRILGVYSSEMAVRFENEYRNEFSKEKARCGDTTYELQCQMENLNTDMSLIKGKMRHAKISMQEDLDKERDILEERFIREQEEMRSLIKMIALKQGKSDHNESSKVRLNHGQHLELLCSSLPKEKYSRKDEMSGLQTNSSNVEKHCDSQAPGKSLAITSTLRELSSNKETQTEIHTELEDLLKESCEIEKNCNEKLKTASPQRTNLPKDKKNMDDSHVEEHSSTTSNENSTQTASKDQIPNDLQNCSNENDKNDNMN